MQEKQREIKTPSASPAQPSLSETTFTQPNNYAFSVDVSCVVLVVEGKIAVVVIVVVVLASVVAEVVVEVLY